MKKRKIFGAFVLGLIFLGSAVFSSAQTETKRLIKRTTYKTETAEFGAGGTISIVGAPVGSIEIEGWQKPEVEVSAEIIAEAETEADLAHLSAVNGFVVENSPIHIRITSVGTHDKRYVKRAAKDFPKKLLGAPFRIDYKIKVPAFSDLNVDGGKGSFNLSGVEGTLIIKYLETDANLKLYGGAVSAIFGSGNVEVTIDTPSWRGRNADIQLASGEMNVNLPPNLSADLTASVLRTGKIEKAFEFLKPRGQTNFSEKLVNAKAGNGGAMLSFTVGDGTLRLSETTSRQAKTLD